MGWSTVPMLMFLALKQFIDGLEFTKTAMMLALLSIPMNVFLNYLFICGKWGLRRYEHFGSGIWTQITRILIFIVLFWIGFISLKYVRLRILILSVLTYY